jgi:hypothetical protein
LLPLISSHLISSHLFLCVRLLLFGYACAHTIFRFSDFLTFPTFLTYIHSWHVSSILLTTAPATATATATAAVLCRGSEGDNSRLASLDGASRRPSADSAGRPSAGQQLLLPPSPPPIPRSPLPPQQQQQQQQQQQWLCAGPPEAELGLSLMALGALYLDRRKYDLAARMYEVQY